MAIPLLRDTQRTDIQRKREPDYRGRGGSHADTSQGMVTAARSWR